MSRADRVRGRGGPRPRGRRAARGPLRRARVRLDVVQRPPGRQGPRDPGRVRGGGAGGRPRRRGDRARSHPAGGDRRRRRAPRARPGAALARGRRRLLGETADPDARVAPGAPRAAPRRAAGPCRDGAEDVRAGGLRLRRRLLQLDDARVRGERPDQGRGRRRPRRAARRRRSSDTSAPRSATTPPGGWPRRSRSTATSTTATANHFDRLDEPEGTVGVAAADGEDARRKLAAYTALDTIVVRGLASANVDSMTAVAEAAAAPRMRRAALVALALAVIPGERDRGRRPAAARRAAHEVVHDYLAPISAAFRSCMRFPVGELPRRFGPLGLDISPPLELPNTGQVLGPTFRFLSGQRRASLDLDLTFTLTRLNGRGRAIGKPRVKRRRLRSLTTSQEPTLGVRISGRPALYRIEMLARNGSGTVLDRYGAVRPRRAIARATPACCSGRRRSTSARRPRSGSPNSAPASSSSNRTTRSRPSTASTGCRPRSRRAPRPTSLRPDRRLRRGHQLLEAPDPTGTAPGLYRLSEPVDTPLGSPPEPRRDPPGAQHRIHGHALTALSTAAGPRTTRRGS